MLTRTPFARFLLITLGITGLYLALDQVWLALTPTLSPLANARTEAAWSDEAAEVERRSREADRRAPPGWHVAAYRLGFEVGYCSNLLGSFTMSSPEIQAKAREAMEPRLASIRDLARALGLDEAPLVPVNNADQFGRISERVEADETGVATRVEQVASLRHRHLFLLGMHSGISAALADSLRGETFNPLRAYLGRHATLAGVPLAAWEPVASVPAGATPGERLAAYRAALAALEQTVARLEAYSAIQRP